MMMAGLLLAAAAATGSPSLRGTWELEAGRSAHDRVIGETVVIGGDDGRQTYSATVRYKGATSGAKFSAVIDGPEAPLISLDGKELGRAKVTNLGPNHSLTVMALAGAATPTILERRLSIDGNTMISLILDGAGKVKSILVFRRTR